jgi:hypothetical protein
LYLRLPLHLKARGNRKKLPFCKPSSPKGAFPSLTQTMLPPTCLLETCHPCPSWFEGMMPSEVVGPWSSVRKGPRKRREEGTPRRSRKRSGDGDSARSQLIQICSLLRAPYQSLSMILWILSEIVRPKPSEHPYPRPNPSQQEWLSLSPETFSDACLH